MIIGKNRFLLKGTHRGGQYVGLELINTVRVITNDDKAKVIAKITIRGSDLVISRHLQGKETDQRAETRFPLTQLP